ncbi:MAG: hypothetical protein V4539_06845 [Bacteroidota bacterium]
MVTIRFSLVGTYLNASSYFAPMNQDTIPIDDNPVVFISGKPKRIIATGEIMEITNLTRHDELPFPSVFTICLYENDLSSSPREIQVISAHVQPIHQKLRYTINLNENAIRIFVRKGTVYFLEYRDEKQAYAVTIHKSFRNNL